MRFRFNTQYCPGKWLRGPDAVSRYPTIASIDLPEPYLLDLLRQSPTDIDTNTANATNDSIEATITEAIHAFHSVDHNVQLITSERVRAYANTDTTYQELLNTIERGFPLRKQTLSELRPYWDVHLRLSTWNGM